MGAVAVAPYSKNDGEPAIVALQETVKNSKQIGTILENSPKETVSQMEQQRTQ